MRENQTILSYGTWDVVTPKKQRISAVKRKITENIAQTAEIEITDYTKLGTRRNWTATKINCTQTYHHHHYYFLFTYC